MSASSRPPERTSREETESRHSKASVGHRQSSALGGTTSSGRLNSASSSSGSTYRRQSLFGTEDRIVLEIGSRMTKVGFSGEARPREIFYTLEGSDSAGPSTVSSTDGLLWTTDLLRCKTDEERSLIQARLKSRITVLLRDIFFKRLMVDPKQRKLIIIEGALMPTLIKQTLNDVLFGNLQVPLVSFVPSHILCALAIGKLTSIVLDVGYQEAIILPVHYGRALTHPYLMTTPRAGKRLAMRLRALLLHYAKYIPSSAIGSGTASLSSMASSHKVPAESLTWTFIDQVVAKALFVADRDPDADSAPVTQEALELAQESALDWKSRKPFSAMDEAGEEAVMKMLEGKYKRQTSTKDMTISLPCPSPDAALPASQPATLGAPVAVHSALKGSIIVPGWIRERAAEVLFEEDDDDEMSLVELVLKTLVKLPVDIRSTLAGSIHLVGGTAMLPGLAERLRKEIIWRLENAGAAFKESKGNTPIVALTAPRIGMAKAKVAMAAYSKRQDGHEQTEANIASKSREEIHEYGSISQLASSVRFPNEQADADRDKSPGSLAPAFAVNLSSWIGGSLMGSLQVESADHKYREAWDLEQEELAARRKDAAGEGGIRPGMGAGRGSFLGSVTGLDLGSYGPLSAHSRGAFTGAGSGTSPRSPKVA